MFRLLFFQVSTDVLVPFLIGIGVLAAALVASIIGIIVRVRKPKKPTRVIDKSAYMDALGGEDNLISHVRKGSRIELTLKDYEAIDKEKLKEAGVDGFIKMSDRLTLVIKGDAEAVEQTLFGTTSD